MLTDEETSIFKRYFLVPKSMICIQISRCISNIKFREASNNSIKLNSIDFYRNYISEFLLKIYIRSTSIPRLKAN